jgi:hypothetical protein
MLKIRWIERPYAFVGRTNVVGHLADTGRSIIVRLGPSPCVGRRTETIYAAAHDPKSHRPFQVGKCENIV